MRLAALLALSEMPPSVLTAHELVVALNAGAVSDRWLVDAATAAAAANAEHFLRQATALVKAGPRAEVVMVTTRVADHYARGGPTDSIGAVMAGLAEADPTVADAVVLGLAKGWPKGRPAQLDEEAEKALVALVSKLSPDARGPLVTLADRWGSKALDRYSTEVAVEVNE